MDSVLRGIPASSGIVVGPVHLLRWEVPEIEHRPIPEADVAAETQRFRAALGRARERLDLLRERTEAQAGAEEARIFDVQLSMLADADLVGAVETIIAQKLAAEAAFDIVMLEWRRKFERHTNPMMRERAGDLTDVHIRVISLLLELPDHDPVDVPKGANAILVTHDLTPSLTMQLDREAIAGIVTEAGTATAHVAILARSLGLPAIVGARRALSILKGDEIVILDGGDGTLTLKPTDAEIADARSRAAEETERETALREVALEEAVTLDGIVVTVRANVDIPDEAVPAANSGADGVGLMRTEFLVLGRTTMPDEEEQYRAYRRVVEAFRGRPVTIRTYDVGGDKLPVGGYPAEANPFLGWRAIRMCLDEPEIFRTQLRALLRAAVHGDVRIMLPLVVTVDEVREARILLEEAAAELKARHVPYRDDVPLGVMVETPAAAIAADTLVRDADFFSIGSNDLVQYVLATDRGNANLAPRYTPLHPAVMRLIRSVAETAAKHAMPLAVCGEMASQPLTVFALLGLGVRQLSVSPRAVPAVKRLIRTITVAGAREALDAALEDAGSARQVEAVLRRRLRTALGE